MGTRARKHVAKDMLDLGAMTALDVAQHRGLEWRMRSREDIDGFGHRVVVRGMSRCAGPLRHIRDTASASDPSPSGTATMAPTLARIRQVIPASAARKANFCHMAESMSGLWMTSSGIESSPSRTPAGTAGESGREPNVSRAMRAHLSNRAVIGKRRPRCGIARRERWRRPNAASSVSRWRMPLRRARRRHPIPWPDAIAAIAESRS